MATAAATAATASAREATGRSRRTIGTGRGKHGKLNRGVLARALRAANLLLFVNYNLLEALITAITDIFVNRHVKQSPKRTRFLRRREV